MICPYTAMDKAELVARSLHKAITELALPHEDSPCGVVTVSIGYAAAVPDGKCTFAQLLHAADDALYAAKTDGRDCVRGVNPPCAGPAVDNGPGLFPSGA